MSIDIYQSLDRCNSKQTGVCTLDITFSNVNFVGYSVLKGNLDSIIDSLDRTNKPQYHLSALSLDEDRVWIKLELHYFDKDPDMAVIDSFLFSLGNIKIYQKRIEYVRT